MKKRHQYQSDRQLKRQENILYTTRKLASKVRYEGLTMRGIAQASEVSPKTLYNLFSSKDELLAAALEDLVGIVQESMGNYSDSRGIDYILTKRKISSEAIMRSPGFANVIITLFFKAKPGDRLVSALLGGVEQEMVEQLQFEKDEGSIAADLDLAKVSAHLTAQTWGGLLLWDKGLISLDQLGDEIRRSFLLTFVGITSGKKKNKLLQELIGMGNRE